MPLGNGKRYGTVYTAVYARGPCWMRTATTLTRISIEWDAASSDGGANYHLDSARPNTVGGNVILNKATARRGSQAGSGFVFTTSWVEGEIFVKNLSFQKHVGIRPSFNGGASFHDTNASFSGNVSVAVGVSQWKSGTSRRRN